MKSLSLKILVFSFLPLSLASLYATENVQTSPKKQVRVYVDMVCDLFHAGHIQFIKQARELGDYLIVGLMSDEDTASYKRLPILTLAERTEMVKACRYVDEVIPGAPLSADEDFIDKHHIDIIVHGDDFNQDTINKYYLPAIKRGIFRTVPYTKGISTSDIINRIFKNPTIQAPKS